MWEKYVTWDEGGWGGWRLASELVDKLFKDDSVEILEAPALMFWGNPFAVSQGWVTGMKAACVEVAAGQDLILNAVMNSGHTYVQGHMINPDLKLGKDI